MKEMMEKCLDSQLWHVCAGGMVQMPPVNSKVIYFPQGHAEHTHGDVDFGSSLRIPPHLLCRVSGVKFMADSDSDEVYAKIRLVPLRGNESDYSEERVNGNSCGEVNEKPASFAKTLTQSDANNGGGFSVPRYCAETIFPRLDYSAEPPLQTILAKDVHGEIWKFRHIYRGTPRRHLLTTGWSTFVNQKKLVAGDSIVFLRTEQGDLCVGIRRAKRLGGGGPECSLSGWNPSSCGGFSALLRDDENKLMRNGDFNGSYRAKGKVRSESIIEAATLAANGQPFEVVYYPRASTPEFCIKASTVEVAMQIRWCPGMRFKMPFETEDSSRISWFMGTISSVQVADPIRWPNSPWRLLQVTWDEPDLLQNVKRVSPWLVELVSTMPAIYLSPFSPPRKKVRLPQNTDFPFDGQFSLPPSFSTNPLESSSPMCCIPSNIPAGIQGARHAQFGISLSDLQQNKLQSGLFPPSFPKAPPSRISNRFFVSNPSCGSDDVSCLLTMGNSYHSAKKTDEKKTTQLVLFGQPILTEQQISLSLSDDSSSDGNQEKTSNFTDKFGAKESSPCTGLQWYKNDSSLESGQCKVFMESDDVGRTLDLSILGSYEELYRKVTNMFGIENSNLSSQVLYQDLTGSVKYIGDEPFSDFMKTTKRLTVLSDSSSDNDESRACKRKEKKNGTFLITVNTQT